MMFAPAIFLGIVGVSAATNGIHTDHNKLKKIEVVVPNKQDFDIQCIGGKALKFTYNGQALEPIPVEHCDQTDYKP